MEYHQYQLVIFVWVGEVMAYRDAVAHIEKLNPAGVEFVGRECLNASGFIKSALPSLTGIPARLRWRAERPELVDRQLGELAALAEVLYRAYDKAAPVIGDYVEAQRRAQECVREGIAAEERLKELIAPIIAAQPPAGQGRDALRQWNDLRETTGEAIDRVRSHAQTLWCQATEAYDRAIRLEHEARLAVADQLGAMRSLLLEAP